MSRSYKDHRSDWTLRDIPDQRGRVAVVTGANSGLGYETATALAAAGAEVVAAARSEEKGRAAVRRIRGAYPEARVAFEALDLADLASVAGFAARVSDRVGRVDLLVNNAGVASPSRREETADGFELQIGTNHLGHFALTAGLLPALARSADARVVTVSSVMHKAGRIDLDDLHWTRRRYSPVRSYCQSKLANLLFAQELQRRSDTGGWRLTSVAAHPGMARTELTANGPGLRSVTGRMFTTFVQPFLTQSAAAGALSSLYAATATDARAGGYYGPSGAFEILGPPSAAKLSGRARDVDVGRALWERSETLVGVGFTAPIVPVAPRAS